MRLHYLLFIGFLGLIFYSCNKSLHYNINLPTAYDLPRNYVVHRIDDSIIMDGIPSEKSWDLAKWSESFIDIRGKSEPSPFLDTKFKMLWSEDYLYVYCQMEEPHVWGKITERDAVIYYDDDFEIFIDPDGDGHNYTEIEVNPLNSVWDLFLQAPYGYSIGNKVLWQWDIRELRTAIHIEGTLNDPSDTDEYWSVEIAIPIKMLNEFAGDQIAKTGAQWRINFSRVDWPMLVGNGAYEKKMGNAGKPLPANNWVWSSQGKIAMHIPEKWGYVQFSDVIVGRGKVDFLEDSDYQIKQSLYTFFHKLKQTYNDQKTYPKKISFNSTLNMESCKSNFNYESIKHRYEVSYLSCKTNKVWVINEKGRLYSRLPS